MSKPVRFNCSVAPFGAVVFLASSFTQPASARTSQGAISKEPRRSMWRAPARDGRIQTYLKPKSQGEPLSTVRHCRSQVSCTDKALLS